MQTICLRDWVPPLQTYVFEFDGKRILTGRRCEDNTLRPQGVFSNEMLGMFWAPKSIVAIFSDGQSLQMSINDKLYNLCSANIIAVQRAWCFFAHEFILLDRGKIIFKLRYFSGRSDAAGMLGDIFEYAANITESVNSKVSFFKMWNGNDKL